MICLPCRARRHKDCLGQLKDRTWCDCQHKDPSPVRVAIKVVKKAA